MSTGNAIVVDWGSEQDQRHYEADAGGTVTPGMILARSGATVIAHATALGATSYVALADLYQGNEITDDYASGAKVFYAILRDGAAFNGILTTSQTVVVGDPLTSTGDGTLSKATLATDKIVGYAREAVTTTAATARIICEVAKGDQVI